MQCDTLLPDTDQILRRRAVLDGRVLCSEYAQMWQRGSQSTRWAENQRATTTGIIAFILCDVLVSLTGTNSAKDAAADQTEQEGDREEAASKAGHVGHRAYKKSSFEDE